MQNRRRILQYCSFAAPAFFLPRSIRAQAPLLGVELRELPSSHPSPGMDGRSRAPSGTPQWPNLLDGYAARPPWSVAGVDYPVGPELEHQLRGSERRPHAKRRLLR